MFVKISERSTGVHPCSTASCSIMIARGTTVGHIDALQVLWPQLVNLRVRDPLIIMSRERADSKFFIGKMDPRLALNEVAVHFLGRQHLLIHQEKVKSRKLPAKLLSLPRPLEHQAQPHERSGASPSC